MNTARLIHPGEILREEFLAPLDLPARALATALQVPAPYINDVVREKRGVTPDIAQRLARYFDTAPQFWTDLQASYDSKLARLKPKATDITRANPRNTAR
jgi:antitoxin HigA-1